MPGPAFSRPCFWQEFFRTAARNDGKPFPFDENALFLSSASSGRAAARRGPARSGDTFRDSAAGVRSDETRRTVSELRRLRMPSSLPRTRGPPWLNPTGDAPASTPSAGRPRSEEAHRAILDATLALLVEVGYSGLTVEGVAQRAGVGKATIYRRWPSKLPLVIEAFRQLPGLEEADTGDLATDLEQMLRSYLRTYHSTPARRGRAEPGGRAAAQPRADGAVRAGGEARRQPLIRALERARRARRDPAGHRSRPRRRPDLRADHRAHLLHAREARPAHRAPDRRDGARGHPQRAHARARGGA